MNTPALVLPVVAWLVMMGKSVGVVAVDTGCATGILPLIVVVIGMVVVVVPGLVELVMSVVVVVVVVEQLVQSVQELHSELHALLAQALLFVQPGHSEPGHLSSGQEPKPHGPAAPVGHGPSSVQVVCVDQDPRGFHALISSQSLVALAYAPVLLQSSVAPGYGIGC